MQVLQGGTRIGTQLVGQSVPQPPVVIEGVARAARTVQGQHELAGEPLVQRMAGGQRRQDGQHTGVVAERQPPFRAVEFGRVPLLRDLVAH